MDIFVGIFLKLFTHFLQGSESVLMKNVTHYIFLCDWYTYPSCGRWIDFYVQFYFRKLILLRSGVLHRSTLIPEWISDCIHYVWDGMKLLIYTQTSMAQPLKFGNRYAISSYTLLGMWLLIDAVKGNPCWWNIDVSSDTSQRSSQW